MIKGKRNIEENNQKNGETTLAVGLDKTWYRWTMLSKTKIYGERYHMLIRNLAKEEKAYDDEVEKSFE